MLITHCGLWPVFLVKAIWFINKIIWKTITAIAIKMTRITSKMRMLHCSKAGHKQEVKMQAYKIVTAGKMNTGKI